MYLQFTGTGIIFQLSISQRVHCLLPLTHMETQLDTANDIYLYFSIGTNTLYNLLPKFCESKMTYSECERK